MQNILQSFTPEEVRFFLEKQSELGGMALLELLIKKRYLLEKRLQKKLLKALRWYLKKSNNKKL